MAKEYMELERGEGDLWKNPFRDSNDDRCFHLDTVCDDADEADWQPVMVVDRDAVGRAQSILLVREIVDEPTEPPESTGPDPEPKDFPLGPGVPEGDMTS